jgi:hypothetical protein
MGRTTLQPLLPRVDSDGPTDRGRDGRDGGSKGSPSRPKDLPAAKICLPRRGLTIVPGAPFFSEAFCHHRHGADRNCPA